jgi:hypothetical protein
LTRIVPAALRLMVIVLSRLSPKTLSVPVLTLNEAVTAWDRDLGAHRGGRAGAERRQCHQTGQETDDEPREASGARPPTMQESYLTSGRNSSGDGAAQQRGEARG